MTEEMTTEEAFEALRRKYGSHSAAARALSINVSHYRALRNGRVNIPNRMREFLRIKAEEKLSALVSVKPVEFSSHDHI